MKNKLKKIITTTVISAVSLTAIGCGTNNNKLAKKIDKSMENFVSSINNLDYVETSSAKAPTTSRSIGKIVETSASDTSTMKIKANGNNIQFLNNDISEAEIENTITIPSERTDNFSLFILTNTPYISFTSDDNNSLNMNVRFSTDQIEETSDEIESKINSLILKRSILMIYVNEIYNGNVNISNENKLAINAYVNVIKENTSFLNGNRGMVKNQLSLASDLVSSEENENLINYYIIKSGEALETRASKLDSTISAIDSIINIIEANLTNSSTYYQTNLSSTYNDLIANTNKIETVEEITESSSNEQIANKIACTLDFCNLNNNKQTENQAEISNQNNNNNTNPINDQNLSDANNLNLARNTNDTNNSIQNNQNSRQSTNLNQNNRQNDTKFNNTNHMHNHQEDNQITPNTTNNQVANNRNNLNTNTKQNTNTINSDSNTQTNTQTNNNQTRNQTSVLNEEQNNTARRVPNSTRQKRLNHQDKTINSTIKNTNEENQIVTTNNTKSRNLVNDSNLRNKNMENENKTMRAQRTPENLTHEEYTTTSVNTANEPRATRVPYTSSTNNFKR